LTEPVTDTQRRAVASLWGFRDKYLLGNEQLCGAPARRRGDKPQRGRYRALFTRVERTCNRARG